MNNIEHLIISSTIDYTTDLICYEFERRNKKYLRINRDEFAKYDIIYDVNSEALTILINKELYCMDSHLRSVYFRAPVFIRSNKSYTVDEQLYRSQWNAFIRNLIVFENAIWVNNPVNTYKAENKLYQLQMAKKIGFNIPRSYIGNSLPNSVLNENNYIVKSLDTALFYENEHELFTYSTVVSGNELKESYIQNAPIILQDCIHNKIDIRVTVIGDKLFPVAIKCNGFGIDGDWRKMNKTSLSYTLISLPENVKNMILKLMRVLNLNFGGVDLMLSDEKYYFVEINPTGEWGWLVRAANLPLYKEIVNFLIQGG